MFLLFVDNPRQARHSADVAVDNCLDRLLKAQPCALHATSHFPYHVHQFARVHLIM
jgi:hypothetical protein